MWLFLEVTNRFQIRGGIHGIPIDALLLAFMTATLVPGTHDRHGVQVKLEHQYLPRWA
jgi:hypothetical protein